MQSNFKNMLLCNADYGICQYFQPIIYILQFIGFVLIMPVLMYLTIKRSIIAKKLIKNREEYHRRKLSAFRAGDTDSYNVYKNIIEEIDQCLE